MTPELHLFIIWSNARYKEAEILSDMASRFKILGIHTVTWEKSHFSANLTRFYGENLPPHSNKEKLCGNGPFTLVVVLDENPLYRTRMTSKGPKVVNVNLFDSKEMYRHWTGGGHMIHGTNSDAEVRHDLVLLTGLSKDDYLKKAEEAGTTLSGSFGSMPGEESWRDMNQLLYVLNETVEYVVLRNFNGLFSDYNKSIHGDVDILTSNRYLARLALNAKPVHRSKRRVQHIVKIGDGGTYFDIRYVGDNYYCKAWEKEILEKRHLTSEGYYRTDDENFAYSLLYHALVQKPKIADDYKETFRSLFPGKDEKELKQILLEYLRKHGYKMNEPFDYTVYFNESITGKKMSTVKFINKAWHRVFK
jgi:hypothetical protein